MTTKVIRGWILSWLAPNMRAPQGGFRGWLAMRLMEKNNPPAITLGIQRLHLSSHDDIFVELGAGHGWGLRSVVMPRHDTNTKATAKTAMATTGPTAAASAAAAAAAAAADDGDDDGIPKRIVCVEISEQFRKKLEQVKVEPSLQSISKRIEIQGEDCRQMPYLEDGSVDKMFGMNVVYFLDPLADYVREFYRVLKPRGILSFGCYFHVMPQSSNEFVNVKEGPIVQTLEDAGFEVMVERDLGRMKWTEIKAIKK